MKLCYWNVKNGEPGLVGGGMNYCGQHSKSDDVKLSIFTSKLSTQSVQ